MSNKQLLVTNRQAVRESFGKSNKDIEKDIGILKKWLETQRHLPEIPTDDLIEMFLVNNKFSIERSKQNLDMYYTIRTLIPEFYENSNPQLPQMLEVPEKMGIFIPLPRLTDELFRVYVMKVWGSPEDFDTCRFYANALNVMEVRIQHDIALGDVYIIDYDNLKMGHVMKMTPTLIKKAATISEKVFAGRIKGIHLVNYPSYVDILMNISKTIFKPKLLARIHLHNSIEDLYKYVPREKLPKDYGGDEPSLQELNDLWKINLKEHSDRFDKLDKMKVKEELRPTPLQNHDVLGYHGNFKKLDVD